MSHRTEAEEAKAILELCKLIQKLDDNNFNP